MEDVLFDYHLVQGMLDQMPYDSAQLYAQRYLDAVFVKHGTTEAAFDSSMTWYLSTGKKMSEIYVRLNDRFNEYNKELTARNGSTARMSIYGEGGDTTNIHFDTKIVMLRGTPLTNSYTFTLNADSSLRLGDKYILTADIFFLREVREDRSSPVLIGLVAKYASGKTNGTNRYVDDRDNTQITFETSAEDTLKSLYGYIRFLSDSKTRKIVMVRNINLVRMHQKAPEPAVPEPVDSVEQDTLVETEVVEESKPSEPDKTEEKHKKADILKAPLVRTRNSYGTRKRK